MLDRLQLEALDRSLRDLMGQPDQPFGGKILLLAGDFRQCLPVVPGANRAGTVDHCINQSHLWKNFQVLQLTKNMRVRASGDPVLEAFDRWTLAIGDGSDKSGSIAIPLEMAVEIIPNTKEESWREAQSMNDFCKYVFPDLKKNYKTAVWVRAEPSLLLQTKKLTA